MLISLDDHDAHVVSDFNKCARAFMAGLEERPTEALEKLSYSKRSTTPNPVGYAATAELHGYLVDLPSLCA